jgi:hypothetical protein
MNQSIWRAPDLSARWWPVFLRNLLVWKKLAIPSLVGNIAEPLMWLVAFGYGMGALVGQVQVGADKVPYILFLASGSICMSAMNAASFEALVFGVFAHARAKDLGRHHERAGQPGQRGAGRDAVGRVQGAVHRHGHPGRDAGPGHQPQPQTAGSLAGAAGRGHHLQLHCADLQCAGQGLRLLHLLLHAVPYAHDVFVGRVLSARPVAVCSARGVRLAAADQCGGDRSPAVHGPVACAPPAPRAGAAGLYRGGVLGGAWRSHAKRFSA